METLHCRFCRRIPTTNTSSRLWLTFKRNQASRSSLRTSRRKAWMSSSRLLVSIAPLTLRRLVGYRRSMRMRRSSQLNCFRSWATWMMRSHQTASFQCNVVRRKVLLRTRQIPYLSMIYSSTRTLNAWLAFSQLAIQEEEASWKSKNRLFLILSRSNSTRGETPRKRWASLPSKMASIQARRKL